MNTIVDWFASSRLGEATATIVMSAPVWLIAIGLMR